MKKLTIILSICLFTISTSVSAQEATLEETNRFLEKNIEMIKCMNDSEFIEWKGFSTVRNELRQSLFFFHKKKGEMVFDILHYHFQPKHCHFKIESNRIYVIPKVDKVGYLSVIKFDNSKINNMQFDSEKSQVVLRSGSDINQVMKALLHWQKLAGFNNDLSRSVDNLFD